MKTHLTPPLSTAILGVAVFTFAACTEHAAPPPAPAPPPSAAPAEPQTPHSAAPLAPSASISEWNDFKDHTYDMRPQVAAGLKLLNARVDAQIAELAARRAAMTGLDNPKAWDFAMKEMGNSRSYLVASSDELNKATADNWTQLKEKVGRAWERTQDAYDKVRTSVTN